MDKTIIEAELADQIIEEDQIPNAIESLQNLVETLAHKVSNNEDYTSESLQLLEYAVLLNQKLDISEEFQEPPIVEPRQFVILDTDKEPDFGQYEIDESFIPLKSFDMLSEAIEEAQTPGSRVAKVNWDTGTFKIVFGKMEG